MEILLVFIVETHPNKLGVLEPVGRFQEGGSIVECSVITIGFQRTSGTSLITHFQLYHVATEPTCPI